jgi:hypothetical protein
VRGSISFVVVMLLAGASLEGQAGPRGSQPAKIVKPEAPPAPAHAPAPVVDAHVAPAKPVVQGTAKPVAQGEAKPAVHVEARPGAQPAAKPTEHAEAKPAAHAETKPAAPVPAKPGVQAAAKPGAPPPPAPAKPPARTLEQAAESIAAALAARGVRAPSRSRSDSEPAAPRAPRIKRYALFWPPDDTKWDVQWPIISGRVALTWDEPSETSHQPASD